MDYNFRLFENNFEVSFDNFSGEEISSITDTLSAMLDINDDQIVFYGDYDEKITIKNVVAENMKKWLNKKTPVVLVQYGVNAWGNVEFLFEPLEPELVMNA